MIRSRLLFLVAFVFLAACAPSLESATIIPTSEPTTSSTPVVMAETSAPTKVPTQIADSISSPEPLTTKTPAPFTSTAVIGQSFNGNEISVTKLGSGETAVLLIGGLHAGFAPATTTLAEQVIAHYSENSQTLPAGITLYVIANANPDSLAGEVGEVNGRLNGNGVDLNR